MQPQPGDSVHLVAYEPFSVDVGGKLVRRMMHVAAIVEAVNDDGTLDLVADGLKVTGSRRDGTGEKPDTWHVPESLRLENRATAQRPIVTTLAS